MKKKVLSAVLALSICLSVLPVMAFANEDNRKYYNKNYTLEGNWRQDIINVALAQVGKTKADLHYSVDWCAYFISDCARLANIPESIIRTTGLANADNFGVAYYEKGTHTPQAGDIIIFDFYNEYSPQSPNGTHVGIVYAVDSSYVYTVEGNTNGEGDSTYRVMKKTRSLYYSGIKGYGVPNYHSYGSPSWTWSGVSSATAKFTCSCGDVQSKSATITSAVTTPATETTSGVRTYTATVNFNGNTYTNTKTETVNLYEYSISDDKATITEYNGAGGDIIIPSTLDGYPVSAIGKSAFVTCAELTSVRIPDGVTAIGDYAFTRCSKMKSIFIPDSVTAIGEYAFARTGLTSVSIPGSVTSIGLCAFARCAGLGSVAIPGSVKKISNGTFYECVNMTNARIQSGVTSIDDLAFQDCAKLTDIAIPLSVTDIGEGAFSGCIALADVYYDGTKTQWESITTSSENERLLDADIHFGSYAYTVSDGKATITGYAGAGGDITIPSTLDGYPVSAIGRSAFYTCAELTSVVIPDGVTDIGDYAFTRCSNLTSVVIPDSVTNIGEYAFTRAGLTSVTIPSSVTSIETCAFAKCAGLANVTIPGGVIKIGNSAFYECVSLESVKIPSGVIIIDDLAFLDCTDLASVTIPSSVTDIGEGAFSGCISLADVYYDGTEAQWDAITIYDENAFLLDADIHFGPYAYTVSDGKATITGYSGVGGDITIPSTLGGYPVKAIGAYAFVNCEQLTSVSISESVTEIGDCAFFLCVNLGSIYIPANVTKIGNQAFGYCSSLSGIYVDVENICFKSDAGVLYTKNGETLICYPAGKSDKSFGVFSGVTTIGAYAFAECSALEAIAISEGVTEIEVDAFCGCDHLKVITIPQSVTSIGSFAFSGCDELTDINFGGTEAQWRAIRCLEYADIPVGATVYCADEHTHAYGVSSWAWMEYAAATAKFTCSCGDEQSEIATVTSAVTTPATEMSEGIRTYTATVTFGGETYTDTKTETIPKLTPVSSDALTFELASTQTMVQPGEFAEMTLQLTNKTDDPITVGACQVIALYDASLLTPVSTGATPFKNSCYTTKGTTIDEEELSLNPTVGISTPGVISVAFAGSDSYTIAPGETMTLLRINFEIREADDCETTIAFDANSTYRVFDAQGAAISDVALGNGAVWSVCNYILGDVNMDREILANDAQLVLSWIVGNTTLTDVQKKAADVNHDNEILANDAQAILNYIVGNILAF